MSANEENGFICLHPQLLTKSTLIYHLERRCVSIQHLSSMSKEKLVEIFQRVALPLPQRKYRQNRRGKQLTKLRAEKEGRKAKREDKKANVSYGFSDQSGSQLQVSLGAGDRLKPPPDSVNYERRKIRLSSGSSSKSSDLDHIQIKKRREEAKNGLINHVDKRESNGERRTKGSSSGREEKSSSKSKIVLKRSHSASSKHDDASSEKERKKEKRLITWP